MNIEAGSISAAIGSVATSPSIASSIGSGVIGAAPAIEAGGFSVSGFGIGAEITTLSSSIINESPVGNDFRLSDTVPLAINTFSELNAANAVFEAESILSQAAKPDINSGAPDVFRTALIDVDLNPVSKPVIELARLHFLIEPNLETSAVQPDIIRQPAYWYADNPQVAPLAIPSQREYTAPIIYPLPGLEPDTKLVDNLAVQLEPDQRVNTKKSLKRISTLVSPLPSQNEQIQEQETEGFQEIVKVDKQEIVDKTNVLHVIDVRGVSRRISHIVDVFIKVLKAKQNLNEKDKQVKIKGSEATSQLLPSNKQLIRGGEINRKDPEENLPDKTWEETIKNLTNLEFTSEEQIEKEVPKIVLENHPVDVSEQGEEADQKNIALSHQYINSRTDAQLQFERRIQLKKQQIIKQSIASQHSQSVIFEEEKREIVEGTINDHPQLAEVLGVNNLRVDTKI